MFIHTVTARRVRLLAAAGALDSHKDMTPDVERWARGQGFTHLLIAGRAGWARVHDWRHYQTILLKELA